MNKPRPLRLIVFHDSINDALALASQLRNAGIQAQARYAEDLPQLHELLREEEVDLVLHLMELSEPALSEVKQALDRLSLPIPLIAMSLAHDASRLDAAINAGADDLINLASPVHVLHAIKRAADSLHCQRRLMELETMHQESERRARALMESSHDAIAYVHGGMHIHANSVYLETFGFKRFEDMEGTPLLDHLQSKDQTRLRELMRPKPGSPGGGAKLDDVEFIRQDGSFFTAVLELSPASIDGEPCTQVLIRMSDDTRALEEQINFLSQRDLLTGLYNRQYFFQQLESRLTAAREGGQQGALIHVQIGNVEEIKSKLGVAGLDVLITDAGKLIEQLVGSDVLLSRYSAHAFALLSNASSPEEAQQFAQSIHTGLLRHIFEVGGHSATVKAFAGIALLDQDTPSVNELLNRAERATRDAESRAPAHVAIYEPKEGELSQSEEDEKWSRMLRNALRGNRFRLLFQPLLSLNGDTSHQRYECFLRLLDDDDQAVSPSEFFAAAERTELSHTLDRWVILHALQAIFEARQRGLNAQLFVRVSSRSVMDPEFPTWLGERLKAVQVLDGSLVLEISESVITDHLKQVKDMQRQLDALHCTILIDGFGHGDDPFRILNYVDAPWLKLSRSLMDTFPTQKANQAKVRELIKACRERGGGQLIIPHVEDATTLHLVLAEGADFVQGNFVQPPVERLDFDFGAF